MNEIEIRYMINNQPVKILNSTFILWAANIIIFQLVGSNSIILRVLAQKYLLKENSKEIHSH